MHTQVDACVCNTAAVEYPLGHVALDTAGFGVDGDAHGMCPSSFWVQVVARLGHLPGEEGKLHRGSAGAAPAGGGPRRGGGVGGGGLAWLRGDVPGSKTTCIKNEEGHPSRTTCNRRCCKPQRDQDAI